MYIHIKNNPQELGIAAGKRAEELMLAALAQKKHISIILATGTSQFETLKYLVDSPSIPWDRVRMFHLDEYIGIAEHHPASFRKYLKERFISLVPDLHAYHLIDGEQENASEECSRLGTLIQQYPTDIALIGIGENGHLAFNDPPADFETQEPFLVVDLDQACRQQQVGEGWFNSMEEVPSQAISMSIAQIQKSGHLVVSVPDARKAFAVKKALQGPVSPDCPASILQQHSSCEVFLDVDSASQLR